MKLENAIAAGVVASLVIATACATKPPVEPVPVEPVKEQPVAVEPKPAPVVKPIEEAKIVEIKAEPEVKKAAPPAMIEVHFAYDSAELNAEAQAVIAEHAQFLIENSEHVATIEGHADERGSENYNQRLGLERATAIKKALIEKGVDERQLRTTSLGELQPKIVGKGENVWRENRRAAFVYETLNQQLSQPAASKRPGAEMFASDI